MRLLSWDCVLAWRRGLSLQSLLVALPCSPAPGTCRAALPCSLTSRSCRVVAPISAVAPDVGVLARDEHPRGEDTGGVEQHLPTLAVDGVPALRGIKDDRFEVHGSGCRFASVLTLHRYNGRGGRVIKVARDGPCPGCRVTARTVSFAPQQAGLRCSSRKRGLPPRIKSSYYQCVGSSEETRT